MSNPIFSSFNSNTNRTNNSLSDLYNQIRNSSNPNQLMQQFLNTDPRFQNIINYINQNGGDAKSAFYNLAAQRGVDPNSILSKLR